METTNYEKFQTSNPVVGKLISRFYERVTGIASGLSPERVLDAGCGEGETLERLAPLLPDSVTGVDLNPGSVEFTRERIPGGEFSVANILDLPFPDDSFDLASVSKCSSTSPTPVRRWLG